MCACMRVCCGIMKHPELPQCSRNVLSYNSACWALKHGSAWHFVLCKLRTCTSATHLVNNDPRWRQGAVILPDEWMTQSIGSCNAHVWVLCKQLWDLTQHRHITCPSHLISTTVHTLMTDRQLSETLIYVWLNFYYPVNFCSGWTAANSRMVHFEFSAISVKGS